MSDLRQVRSDTLGRVGSSIWHARSLASTNATLRELVEGSWAGHGTVVWADEQTSGRGRLDRTWSSPEGGGLFASVYLSPVDATAVYSLASLATRDAVQDVSGLRVSIKWPNDILIAGRKLAGILAEGLSAGVIVGIGINTNLDEDRLGTIGPEATSLSNETSADVDHEGLLERLVVRLEEYYQNAASAPGRLFEDWKRSLVTLGQSVEVETATESWIGVAVDVAVDGSLLVLNDKRLVRVYAGDVRIRPA